MKVCVQKMRRDGFYPVYIRIIHQRKVGYLKTGKVVTQHEVGKSGDIEDPFVLNYCTARILEFQKRLNTVDASHWNVGQVIEFLTRADDDICFSDYARRHYDRMIDNGQVRNAKNYLLALQHLERHFGTTKVMFGQLTSVNVMKWVKSLERTSRAKELYPVCMRQVYKAACAELNDYDTGIIRIKVNPWVKTKIPVADTPQKRAITAEDCRAFFAAPLPDSKMAAPLPELGRDVAMLCLCLAGINTVDLYNLKKADYYNGVIHYRRAKTMRSRADGAYMEMGVPEVVKPLFDKYVSDDEYLFCFHRRHSTSDSFGANANSGIKTICRSMGMPKDKWYCVYTFRHTWATTAQNDCGASLAEVGFAMNHSQRHMAVTRGYVNVDYSPAWELNERVIDFILFSDKQSKQAAQESSMPDVFRLSPKMMIRAAAFHQGRLLATFTDIGYSTVDEVIDRLVAELPGTIPVRSMVQFKIVNMDNDKVAVYERMKGKGF